MKSQLRTDFSKKISILSEDDKVMLSQRIQNFLKQSLIHEKGTWAGYHHLSDEPQINWNEVSDAINWAFPKLSGDSLEFVAGVTEYKKSSLGFREPANGIRVSTDELNGVVMPGLAFDKQGRRLGRGKAFYDRSLQDYKGKKIGLVFDVSFCEELPAERHDVGCDTVITDHGIFNSIKMKEQ